jgi:hypothetical protein
MQIELIITSAFLLIELVIIYFFYYKAKQPPDPAKPRMFNYGLLIIFGSLLFIATLAHIVTLVTGKKVKPRRKRGM